MKTNIKTYRFYANIVSCWYKNYKNGLISLTHMQFIFDTKMNLFSNPYQQNNFEREIMRLIGFNDYTVLKQNYLTKTLQSV